MKKVSFRTRRDELTIEDYSEKLECDDCKDFICWMDEFDLEGNYFLCDKCLQKHKNEIKK